MNILIKSGDKYYYKIDTPSWLRASSVTALVDEQKPVPSFAAGWFIADTRPQVISNTTKRRVHKQWEIKEQYKHLNLPAIVEKFESDEEGDYPSESLFYDQVFDEKDETEIYDIEWSKEIDEDVIQPVEFRAIDRSSYIEKIITISPMSSLVDSLVYPDIVLPSKACALTGDNMFKIVRSHIKTNIDPKYAKITSDYNFCFSVKKLLAITPQERVIDTRTGRQRKPRLTRYTISDREVTIFEMTPPSEKYKGYTTIRGITASNHIELKKKLDKMLKELMEEINKPLASCLHCEGTGVVTPEKVGHGKSNS